MNPTNVTSRELLLFNALRAAAGAKWRRVSIPASTIPGDHNIQNIPAARRRAPFERGWIFSARLQRDAVMCGQGRGQASC